MVEISVIVPIYKGKKYLEYLFYILNKNFENYEYKYNKQCEAIIVNDDPDELIEMPTNGNRIYVYNCKQNNGIHGARVYGYFQSKGNYIVFLDQDDKISENYLISQKQHIGLGDGVVCNGYRERICINGKRAIYAQNHQLQMIKNLNTYIELGNRILSPGQVLLKKSSLPNLWLNEIMKKNGADDYFLWILMLKEKRILEINEDRIFTHKEHGDNTSSEYESMLQSINEMIRCLKKNNLLNQKDCKKILNRCSKDNKLMNIVKVYDYWTYLYIRNRKIDIYLNDHNYRKIAIYGINHIGNRLYDDLNRSTIEVCFGIDVDADGIEFEVPVLNIKSAEFNESINNIDAVIVTAVASFYEIKQNISQICNKPVISIETILLEMINQDN